jgi:hypothetical protein
MGEVLLLRVAQKLNDILIAELAVERIAKLGLVLALVPGQRSVKNGLSSLITFWLGTISRRLWPLNHREPVARGTGRGVFIELEWLPLVESRWPRHLNNLPILLRNKRWKGHLGRRNGLLDLIWCPKTNLRPIQIQGVWPCVLAATGQWGPLVLVQDLLD